MAEKIIDVIKYEGGNTTLIYKHPKTDFNLGTQLIVHESQEAVFFRDGEALESFGPGRHTLETQNLPYLKDKINALANGEHVFHSEVYFINLTTELGVKWGTDSKIRLFDPISGLHLEIGASGTFNIKVNDGRKLLVKVVGTTGGFEQEEIFGSVGYSTSKTIGSFRGMIVSKVKTYLAKAIRENDISVLEIDEHLDELSEILRVEINKVLDSYGMFIPEFHLVNVLLPEPGENPNFDRYRQQYGERFVLAEQTRIAEAEAALKLAIAKGDATAEAEARKILAAAAAEEERLKGLAHAEVLRAQGGDYSAETAREVGVAAASNEGGAGGTGGIASDLIKAGIGVGVGIQIIKTIATSFGDILVASDGTWECPKCHHKGNKGKFCESCGLENPEFADKWDCPECGAKGLTTNFCPNCGHKKGE